MDGKKNEEKKPNNDTGPGDTGQDTSEDDAATTNDDTMQQVAESDDTIDSDHTLCVTGRESISNHTSSSRSADNLEDTMQTLALLDLQSINHLQPSDNAKIDSQPLHTTGKGVDCQKAHHMSSGVTAPMEIHTQACQYIPSDKKNCTKTDFLADNLAQKKSPGERQKRLEDKSSTGLTTDTDGHCSSVAKCSSCDTNGKMTTSRSRDIETSSTPQVSSTPLDSRSTNTKDTVAGLDTSTSSPDMKDCNSDMPSGDSSRPMDPPIPNLQSGFNAANSSGEIHLDNSIRQEKDSKCTTPSFPSTSTG